MMRMKRCLTAIALTAIALVAVASASASAAGAAEPPAIPNEPDRAAAEDVQDRPTKPDESTPRCTSLAGSDSEPALREASASRTTELIDRASREPDEQLALTLRLAAVNIMLAEQLDAPLSRRFLRTVETGNQPTADHVADVISQPTADHVADVISQPTTDRAADVLSRAKALLDSIGATLDKTPPPNDGSAEGPDKKRDKAAENAWRGLKKSHTSLTAFRVALDALLRTDSHEQQAKTMRRAALRLAPLLEAHEPEIVAAAGLFYAVLRADEDSKASALSVLPPVLQAPPNKGIRFAYYARLLRCRLIAKRSSPPAALTLLLQLEDGLDDWFDDDATKNQAALAATLIRGQILNVWKDHLTNDTPPEERRFIQERIDRANANLEESDTGLLRLGNAIPTVVAPPS